MNDEMDFETRLARIRAIVARLDTPDVPLEEGMALFQEGMALCRKCTEDLERARIIVEEAVAGEDGAWTPKP